MIIIVTKKQKIHSLVAVTVLFLLFPAENQSEKSTIADSSVSTNDIVDGESADLVIVENQVPSNEDNLWNFENDETGWTVTEVRSLTNENVEENCQTETESERSKADSSSGVSLFLPR